MHSKVMTITTIIVSMAIYTSVLGQEAPNTIYKWDFNDKSPNMWEIHPEKRDKIKLKMKSEGEKEVRLEVHVPGKWTPCLIARNLDLEGAKTLSFEINPGTNFKWIEVQAVMQSSVTEWDLLGKKHLPIADKWQSLSFNIDMSKHADAAWNQIVIVINCDKAGTVLIDNITITK